MRRRPHSAFEGEPTAVTVTGSLKQYAHIVWDALDADNKVSLFALAKDLATGGTERVIINKNQS